MPKRYPLDPKANHTTERFRRRQSSLESGSAFELEDKLDTYELVAWIACALCVLVMALPLFDIL